MQISIFAVDRLKKEVEHKLVHHYLDRFSKSFEAVGFYFRKTTGDIKKLCSDGVSVHRRRGEGIY
ncbi:ribosomal RNA large subunit methyltransferase H [Bartonella quintana JK 12]|nr:ribosomal RNA large subunit methyltransferase H [Bartonella quintana JK 7]ETS18330.1 ribosomal RNA large subunit methyltransferase H [Bartonella quintana JK 12]KEC59488.1 ribosomal RNA large subunit methyltransferase H [Bartonella quintana JK 19]KEC68707.1 ribosomal RNA large subunit methyltransferase H [Bartonella quintana JK 39]SQF94822.1 Uncharacterised protein [Bartonella quintana]